MIGAFTKDINIKRLSMAILAVFAWIFVSDYLIHGVILKGQYEATPSLWRPEAEMGHYLLWLLLGQFIISKFFVVIFVHGYKGTGIMEGIRYGLYVGILFAGSYFINYAVFPLTCAILGGWIGLGLIQSMGAGIIASQIYRR